tara:strand:+ start:26 stop:208 length:183 start_codon:yes stop_codon:yes gene_type:complete
MSGKKSKKDKSRGVVANDLGGGKKVNGTRQKNKLFHMENKRTNTWDKYVDDWIKKAENKG